MPCCRRRPPAAPQFVGAGSAAGARPHGAGLGPGLRGPLGAGQAGGTRQALWRRRLASQGRGSPGGNDYRRGRSAQAGDVVGHGLDLAVVQLAATRSSAMLFCGRRRGRRPAARRCSRHAGRTGAGTGPGYRRRSGCGSRRRRGSGARRCRRGRSSRPGDQVLVFREAGLGLLAGEEPAMFFMSASDSARSKRLHDRAVALAGLEVLQLLDDVFGVLLRQLGVGRRGRGAVGAVARGAALACRGDGAALAGSALAAGAGRSAACADVGREGRGQGQTLQQRASRLHIGGSGFLAQNRVILQWRTPGQLQ